MLCQLPEPDLTFGLLESLLISERVGREKRECGRCSARLLSLQTNSLTAFAFSLPKDVTNIVELDGRTIIFVPPLFLGFLQAARDFHSRYVTTVVARIFFCVNSSWSGRISLGELRRSNFLKVLASLEVEEDINHVTQYFSYEHFYVIYCKFWEIDTDHDLIITKADLLRHNNYEKIRSNVPLVVFSTGLCFFTDVAHNDRDVGDPAGTVITLTNLAAGGSHFTRIAIGTWCYHCNVVSSLRHLIKMGRTNYHLTVS
ncbi:unnamed protein product [Schistocephalus solidus]|uniref:PP2A regulatory subunit B'' EF-hand domain-containing protein n=1 Tax=Schistocephalus solidus TaxID=70667 RepID=A0A3P7EIT5_SCHSO|nr:unnamed protein product [Schistocephalus solidus]